ncbi:MAG: SDR family NAD(P)-dependent oxidoreductase [Nakamurella sp.]
MGDRGFCDLSGQVAVVTGAGGGVGSGIAMQFARAGASVVLHYRSSAKAAEAVWRQIVDAGGHAIVAQADITDEASARSVIAEAVRAYGRVDALVNNAGVQPVEPLEGMTAAAWHEVVDVNVMGTFIMTQAAAEAMRETGGSVTHIASIEGLHPADGHAHYCSSKAALIMHARTASLEYGKYGIRVNSVSPGLIDREGLEEAWPEGVARYRASAPLGRLGRSTDIGNACVFLASSMAAWVTGTNLTVDGGVSNHPTW